MLRVIHMEYKVGFLGAGPLTQARHAWDGVSYSIIRKQIQGTNSEVLSILS